LVRTALLLSRRNQQRSSRGQPVLQLLPRRLMPGFLAPGGCAPRSYASALAFSAWNSSCVIAPESSSSLAFAISLADPPPAVSRT
jgi:hypothetical protein